MATYNIIRTQNPDQYKEQILQFWNDNLPGTPMSRFDWMNENPAGKAVWFLAFAEDTELAGTISIMPRKMILDGEVVVAGVVGDFMTGAKHRVFGPAMELQRLVVKTVASDDFKFLYTLPNKASIKLTERAKFKNVTRLVFYLKPIDFKYYFQKKIPAVMATLMAPFAKMISILFSGELLASGKGDVRITDHFNDQYQLFIESLDTYMKNGLHCKKDLAFLNWRYNRNPVYKFHALEYRNEKNGLMLGYILFAIYNRRLEIFDFTASDNKIEGRMLKRIIKYARKLDCISINMRMPESSRYIEKLSRFGFRDAHGDACVMVYGESDFDFCSWEFQEGDRNI